MKETIRGRVRPSKAKLVALVTVIALLVAPVCVALCAASTCSSGVRLEPCHEMASMGTEGGDRFVAPSKACGVADFSAVLVKVDEQYLLSQGARNDAASVLLSGSPELGLGSLSASPGRRGVPLVPQGASSSFLLTTILRI